MRRQPAFIFAGGGTAGHIYPALAIWEELAEMLTARGHAPVAHFVCSARPVDAKVLGAAGVWFTPTPANYPGLTPQQLWRFASGWAASVRITRAQIARLRAAGGQVQLVTMGGFVAAPAVQAARVEHVTVTLVNIDAVAGKANRLIARRATRAFTTVPDARFPAWVGVPPIVRRAARLPAPSAAARRDAQQTLGLIAPGEPAKRVLMVTGGSLGARSINELMTALVTREPKSFQGWDVLHQTGNDDSAAELNGVYKRAGVRAHVVSLTDQMPAWWRAAELAVSRAGAGAVAEAWSTATPTLFLPYPFHKDGHQARNAQALVLAGCARVVTDLVEVEKNISQAGAALLGLMGGGAALGEMRDRALLLGPADGAVRVAAALAEAALGSLGA